MNYIPQYEPVITKNNINSVKKQLETGWIGTSDTTQMFETAIGTLTGHSYSLATTSGTMALWLGIMALDIPKDKTILFPSYTFLAGANVIKQLGYNIKFIDIKLDTLCMDPALVTLDSSIGAVFFVDHNGYVGDDRNLIKQMCDAHNIPFIEDSAQGIGIPTAGTLGKFSVFSFSVPKLVTTGQGGILLTNDPKIAERVRRLRDHGDDWRQSKIHNYIGINLKFNDIGASLGLSQLSNLDKLLAKRKKIFDNYRKYIKLIDYGYASTWMVIYRTYKADRIIEQLKNDNIQAVKYYRPIPSNPSFYDDNKYPEAQKAYEQCVYLPSSLNLKRKDIKRICNIIKDIENNER